MGSFFCVGINHKTCPVEIREKVAFSKGLLPHALRALRSIEGIRECLILSTCNRVELYGRGEDASWEALREFLASFHDLRGDVVMSHQYGLREEEVFKHLFRVACGIDSLVVGETEIYSQLKQAFQIALETGSVDSVLYQLIERALRIGKKARAETDISRGAVSVSSVAVELAEKIFGKLRGEQVMVLGTGEMSEKTIAHLVESGAGKIVVVSRNDDRAIELSQKFGAEAIRFDEWLRALRTSDIVISSTASSNPIVRFDDVKTVMQTRRHRPLFLIDIAVPRDIESVVQSIDDVYLYNIDDLQSVVESNIRKRKKEILKCEKMIEEEIGKFKGWLEQLEMKPTLEWLTRHFDQAFEDEIRKAPIELRANEKQIRDLFTRVRKKIFHKPLENLKHVSREGTLSRYLQLLRKLFSDEVSKDRCAQTPGEETNPVR